MNMNKAWHISHEYDLFISLLILSLFMNKSLFSVSLGGKCRAKFSGPPTPSASTLYATVLETRSQGTTASFLLTVRGTVHAAAALCG